MPSDTQKMTKHYNSKIITDQIAVTLPAKEIAVRLRTKLFNKKKHEAFGRRRKLKSRFHWKLK
jgi:hypothetical protein